eukprot:3013222-Amphidinium_carterae.1
MEASLGRHQFCVLPEAKSNDKLKASIAVLKCQQKMRIEAVNGESQNLSDMVDRLKGCLAAELVHPQSQDRVMSVRVEKHAY